jgi:RNA polymerase sigma-70 factor (ECF subfamily)
MTALGVRPTQASNEDPARARRFSDATLPHLDAIYTLARYLLRDPTDAEDATQECYLRALRHFDTLRSTDVKPWLFTILRNVCRAEFGRRSCVLRYNMDAEPGSLEGTVPLWSEAQDTPEREMLRKLDSETLRGLVEELPAVFREVIVLREVEDLSYREIAGIVGSPIGTVMSRLARGRAMLREAWLKSEQHRKEHAGEHKALCTEAHVHATAEAGSSST